jgi:pimeloyl-ACP methyl ester carboxylesterase
MSWSGFGGACGWWAARDTAEGEGFECCGRAVRSWSASSPSASRGSWWSRCWRRRTPSGPRSWRGHPWVAAGLLPQITTPVTLIHGRHDSVVPLANAEFLDATAAHQPPEVIIDVGHFVWEDGPTEYASIILDSITSKRS